MAHANPVELGPPRARRRRRATQLRDAEIEAILPIVMTRLGEQLDLREAFAAASIRLAPLVGG
jgi:hypothetical protein